MSRVLPSLAISHVVQAGRIMSKMAEERRGGQGNVRKILLHIESLRGTRQMGENDRKRGDEGDEGR